MDFEAVAGHRELVFAGDFFQDLCEDGVFEFDQPAAFVADQVIVLGVAVVVFVDLAVVGAGDFAEQAGGDERFQRAVDGGAADAAAVRALRQTQNQLVGIEVFM